MVRAKIMVPEVVYWRVGHVARERYHHNETAHDGDGGGDDFAAVYLVKYLSHAMVLDCL